MAKKISQLPSTGTVDDADVVIVVDGGVTKQSTVAALRPTATATTAGVIELATDAETIAGSDTVRAVTPAVLKAAMPHVDVRSHATIQAAIDATAEGGLLIVPDGTYDTAKLTILKPITIRGQGQYKTILRFTGTDGIEVAAGVSSVQIEDIELATSVRHTTTPNALTGLKVLGATDARPSNHVYHNIYIDGFQRAIDVDWIWSSRFSNVRSNYGDFGIRVTNLSVNNVIHQCSFAGASALNTQGISLDGTTTPSEGWIITDTLIDAFDFGIYGQAVTHVKVTGCIIDHCTGYGIRVTGSATNFGGNWDITNNYIGMSGTATNGIGLTNAISNTQNAGNRIIGNYILAYAGSTVTFGIRASGTQAINNVIMGNTIRGATSADIRCLEAASASDMIIDNVCLSGLTNGIYGGLIRSNNMGTSTEFYERAVQRVNVGKMSITYDQAIPTTGTWKRGDLCFNTVPAATGNTVVGWVCTTAGTPGTWTPFGSLFDTTIAGQLDHDGTTVGFNGATPVGKRTLGAAATDAATTQTLANNLRQALIDLGLGQT